VVLPAGERKRFRKALALLESGAGVLALAAAGNMRLAGLGVYEALLARSWAVRYDDPRQMCHLAKAAVEVAQDFDPKKFGPWRVADYASRAWGELANAYRVADRLRDAEQAFGTAFELYRQGSGDRRLFMRLLDLEASLLGTLREFDLAQERLTTLSGLYQEAGEAHLAGRTLITKALYTYYHGDTEEAAETLASGLALIDRDRDPSLGIAATFNQLLLLVDAGRFVEAKKLLFKNRVQFVSLDCMLKIKLRGIEGSISYGLGQLVSAEIAFREAKVGFQVAGLSFACGLATLDLAMTLMRQGRTEEAIQEGLEATALFVSVSVHREVLGSVLFLEEALRTQRASLALFEQTVRYLRKKMVELGLK
jgi:tetratricopeptide (TPR) repeat protein